MEKGGGWWVWKKSLGPQVQVRQELMFLVTAANNQQEWVRAVRTSSPHFCVLDIFLNTISTNIKLWKHNLNLRKAPESVRLVTSFADQERTVQKAKQFFFPFFSPLQATCVLSNKTHVYNDGHFARGPQAESQRPLCDEGKTTIGRGNICTEGQ